MKKYIVKEDNWEFGIFKGDVFIEDADGYSCLKTDEEVFENSIYKTSSYYRLPASIVENDSAFELELSVAVKEEIKETPVEQVKEEICSDMVNEPLITKVKVLVPFPGGKEGEIFEYSSMTGTFISLTPVDEDEYLATILSNGRRTLTVEEVVSNIDYFEDLTPKVLKTKEEIMDKIADLATQKLELEKSIVDSTNKLFINMTKRQIKTLKSVIEALEWSIGEGKDFIVE